MPEDFIQSPPDSSGKHVHAKMVNDGTEDIYTPVMMLADRNTPANRQAITNKGEAVIAFDGGSPDFTGFGRLTISESEMMAMYKFYQEDYGLYFHKNEVGAGTVTRSATEYGMKLSCGTASGDKAEYHSHRHFQYRPGNSMPLLFTMKGGDAGKTNLTRKVGWFGKEGTSRICFEMSGSDIFTVVEDDAKGFSMKMSRTGWSHDRLDGSGGDNNLSGVTLDPTKASIWWIDFQFLGAGAVVFGTYVDGEKIVCHVNGNYNALDRPYISDASFSFGMEQENTGVTGTASDLFVFCAVVLNEGYKEFDVTVTSLDVTKTISSATFVPIFSFRPKELKNGVTNRDRVLPISIDIFSDTESVVVISEINSPLTGATFAESILNVEYDTVATATAGLGLRKLTGQAGAGVPSVYDNLESAFPVKTSGVHRHYDPATSDHVTVFARLHSGAVATEVTIAMNLKEIQ